MRDERLKTARDEALEMANPHQPPRDPERERDHMLDATLRLLGISSKGEPAQVGQAPENPGQDLSAIHQDLPAILGGPADDPQNSRPEAGLVDELSLHDLSTALPGPDPTDAAADFDFSTSIGNEFLDQGPSVSDARAAIVRGARPAVDITPILDALSKAAGPTASETTTSQVDSQVVEEVVRAIRAAVASNSRGRLSAHDPRPADPQIGDDFGWYEKPGKIELLPYRPAEDTGPKIELLADDVSSARISWPEAAASHPRTFDEATSDGGPGLARPLVLLTVSEAERQAMLGEALRLAAERDKRVLREIVDERMDLENYMRRAQERALYGAY
jgi:hypothetical protein